MNFQASVIIYKDVFLLCCCKQSLVVKPSISSVSHAVSFVLDRTTHFTSRTDSFTCVSKCNLPVCQSKAAKWPVLPPISKCLFYAISSLLFDLRCARFTVRFGYSRRYMDHGLLIPSWISIFSYGFSRIVRLRKRRLATFTFLDVFRSTSLTSWSCLKLYVFSNPSASRYPASSVYSISAFAADFAASRNFSSCCCSFPLSFLFLIPLHMPVMSVLCLQNVTVSTIAIHL